MRSVDAFALEMKSCGIRHFFAVTGGAAVNIIDALIETAGLVPVFHHHEQAAALAAEAYARKHGLGLCVVTTGPGVTNALTGVLTAWQDSIPLIVVSGQARRANSGEGFLLRQAGTQHLRVEPLVQSIVKRFILLESPATIQADARDSVRLAAEPRKGPVWLDFPLDIQLTKLEPSPAGLHLSASRTPGREGAAFQLFWSDFEHQVEQSHKPVLVLGRGASGLSEEVLADFVETLQMPIVTSWGAVNSSAETHPNHVGRIGVFGQRGANRVLHDSDLVLGVGARFCQAVTGANVKDFAPEATMFSVDVDPEENRAIKHLRNVLTLEAEADVFVGAVTRRSLRLPDRASWFDYCRGARFGYQAEYGGRPPQSSTVDLYEMLKVVDEESSIHGEDIVVDGGGTIVYGSMQVLTSNHLRNIWIPAASAPMGTGIPQGIGVSVGNPSAQLWVLVGDGSLMMNLQELQTVAHQKLELGIVVLNNQGYQSIRQTQTDFTGGRFYGSAPEGGLSVPALASLARTFGMPIRRITDVKNLAAALTWGRSTSGPVIIEIIGRVDQEIFPRTKFVQNPDGTHSPLPLSQMFPEPGD
jgi:acetolactate synthase I/II/III large subunit